MQNYNVASEEGLRRLQHLAYTCGVLAIFRQEHGTQAALSHAAWLRALNLVVVCGNGASDIWTAYFARGYADALQRQTRGATSDTRRP